MAGIEPASERLERRTSTSVADLYSYCRLGDPQPTFATSRLDPKALFHAIRDLTHGTPTLCRLSYDRLEYGSGRRGLSRPCELCLLLKQLRALQHNLCVWHLIVVLVLRDRYLSARRSGSASPVEAWHPRRQLYYTVGLLEISKYLS